MNYYHCLAQYTYEECQLFQSLYNTVDVKDWSIWREYPDVFVVAAAIGGGWIAVAILASAMNGIWSFFEQILKKDRNTL